MFGTIGKALTKILGGTKHERDVKNLAPIVEQINQIGEQLRQISNDELRNKTLEFRAYIAQQLSAIDEEIQNLRNEAHDAEDLIKKEQLFNEIDEAIKDRDKQLELVLKEILPEAFAVCREAARRFKENPTLEVTATDHDRNLAAKGKRYISIEGEKATWKNQWTAAGGDITWDMVHYDVQLVGGMVLHDGKVAEMATGEGKTLVATLPAYLNGIGGQGVHIVTVNDYLARRDSEWVGPLYEFLFLTVDCIDKYQPHSEDRNAAYQCDITFGTNNEFGFDYLRDNMVRSVEEKVQAKHHYAIVDEVDSVLIDDARTPLIISGPVGYTTEDQDYVDLKPAVERLINIQRKLATDYLAQARKLYNENKIGVEEGQSGMALLRSYRALPKSRPLIKFLGEEGARVHLQKTENHYMQEQSKHMHLVDAELYFVIDEKNRQVELSDKGVDYLTLGSADPNFYILPDLATELMEIDRNTELTKEEKAEAKTKLSQDFAVKSRRLHAISQLLKAYTIFEADEDYVVMNGEVKIVDEQTGRMMEGRRYSDGLHQALEAKENVKVGEITQTYATVTLQNFFRMYHKLAGMTGTAETEAKELWDIYKLEVTVVPTNRPMTRKDMDDLVFKSSKEKYDAVIDEIVQLSNAGRPVLVGTTSVDISEKLSRLLRMRNIDHNVLNAKQHQREAEIVAEAGRPGKVTIATNMAGRGTDIKISAEVKAAGGLAIIGTERHESRRVDRQLRGRAGRQGDPGTSQFYVSLEDNLMRLFQSERIAGLMDRMGHKEGDVIQHSMVTKSIERAQKKVEENHFGVRKRLLEYDDVMNVQRESIYKKRDNALYGERLSVDLNTGFESMIENLVLIHRQGGNFETFRREAISQLGIDPELDAAFFRDAPVNDVVNTFYTQFFDAYHHKADQIIDLLLPQIQDVYHNQGHIYKRIVIPFTDGSSHPYVVTADLQDAVESKGKTILRDIERTVTLAIIDEKWKEHLRNMDELKESVQAVSFAQKDPLVEYKLKGYDLFQDMFMEVNQLVTGYLSKGTLVFSDGTTLEQAREQRALETTRTQTSRSDDEPRRREAAESASAPREKVSPIRRDPKIGRNDPCPCGSGKKYKQCHGK
ncbi:preprotein translocase subunit SecA [Haliscomenobacter sp.]|uniref:preprotein translocase subunit SecA n=1 Tax=Haliscomenobacter sp. TaxID=2717303 RepID=UPI0035947394